MVRKDAPNLSPKPLETGPDSKPAGASLPPAPEAPFGSTLTMPHVISSARPAGPHAQGILQEIAARKIAFSDGVNALLSNIPGNGTNARRILASLTRLNPSPDERASLERIISKIPEIERPVSIQRDLAQRINESFKPSLWERGARFVEELSRSQFFGLAAKQARMSFADTGAPVNTDGTALFKAFVNAGYSRAEQLDVLSTLLKVRSTLFRQSAAAGEDLGSPKFLSDIHASIAGAGFLGNLPGRRAVAALTEFLGETPQTDTLMPALLRAIGSLQHIAGAAEAKQGGVDKILGDRRGEFANLMHSFKTAGDHILAGEMGRLIDLIPRR